MISIRPTDPLPIYVQIMDEIRRGIAMETLRSHEVLPSVRQLAGELRVNPNTVKQAYRELEREGLVYVRRGQGTFVAEVESAERELRALAAEVAKRALRDAHRHGLSARDLITAIEQADAARSDSSEREKGENE